MDQAEALKLLREVQAQIDGAITKLGTIGPLATFGDGPPQVDFTSSIYDLKSARTRLARAVAGAEKRVK